MTGWEVVSPGEDGVADEDGDGDGDRVSAEDGVGDDVEGEGEVDIEDERAGVETEASSVATKLFTPLPFTTAR